MALVGVFIAARYRQPSPSRVVFVPSGRTGPAASGCPRRPYVDPIPDDLLQLWSSRPRYRLVIGAGKFEKDPAADRAFVGPTARLVDAALASAGYDHNLGLLIDEEATRAKVEGALDELKDLPPESLIVVYYVGHGVPTLLEDDVALGIADEPVNPTHGVRVKDLMARAVQAASPGMRQAPRVIMILETCYSGAVSSLERSLHNIVLTPKIDFTRLSFLSATSGTQVAHPMNVDGKQLSAFGYYLARALTAEWDCADLTPDGALTVAELATFAATRLDEALEQKRIKGPMTPDPGDRPLYAMVAYNKDKVADANGYRRSIGRVYTIEIKAAFDARSIVETLDGTVVGTCEHNPSCRIFTDSPQPLFVRVDVPGYGFSQKRLAFPGLYFMNTGRIIGDSGEPLSVARVRFWAADPGGN